MKKLLPLLLLILIGCSKEPINMDEVLIERNDVYYTKDTNQPYSGPVFRLHKNGIIGQEVNLKDGKPDGLWKSYSMEGDNFYSLVEYKDGEVISIKRFEYYGWGPLFEEMTYNSFDDMDFFQKRRTGSYYYKRYYDNGQLERQGTYKDGKPDGPVKTYHDNGQFRTEENYKDGKEDGLWKVYDINGQLEEERTYKDGELIDVKEY